MGKEYLTITKLQRYSKDFLQYEVSRSTINRWLDHGLKCSKLPFEWRGGRKVVDTELYEKFLKHELYSKPEPSTMAEHGEAVCKHIEKEQAKATMIEAARKETENSLKSYGFRF